MSAWLRSSAEAQRSARLNADGGRSKFKKAIATHTWPDAARLVGLIVWTVTARIGLSQMSDYDWKDDGPCADEYDDYLLQVVGRLQRNDLATSVVAYLEDIETIHMGIGRGGSTHSRAELTVAAISEYLANFPPGPFKVR